MQPYRVPAERLVEQGPRVTAVEPVIPTGMPSFPLGPREQLRLRGAAALEHARVERNCAAGALLVCVLVCLLALSTPLFGYALFVTLASGLVLLVAEVHVQGQSAFVGELERVRSHR